MFLAYVTCGHVTEAKQLLCIVPDKPDQFSSLIPVDSLSETESAYHRVSQLEVMVVLRDDSDGGMIAQAIAPSKLYITPNMHDKPGLAVAQLKIIKHADGRYVVTYIQEGDPSSTWKEWSPKKRGLQMHTGSGAVQ